MGRPLRAAEVFPAPIREGAVAVVLAVEARVSKSKGKQPKSLAIRGYSIGLLGSAGISNSHRLAPDP